MPTNTKALQVAEPAGIVAGKNAVINGGFDIWQRGTSFTMASSNNFGADRWNGYRSATGATVSRQTTGDTTNLPNIQYCARIQRDSGNTSTVNLYYGTSLENINSIPFAGKTITISFYARAGANFSASSNAMITTIGTGTNTDANFVNGSSAGWTTTQQTYNLTTTWTRYTQTITVPTTAVQLGYQFQYTPTGTAGAADYFEITGVQLELGNTATPFSRAGGDIAGELVRCQRYYYRQTSVSSYGWMAYGGCQNTTNGQAGLVLPVQMRVVPTALEYGNVRVVDSSYSGTLTTLALNTGESTPNLADIYVTATGLTGGRPLYIGANNNTGAYLAVTAEL